MTSPSLQHNPRREARPHPAGSGLAPAASSEAAWLQGGSLLLDEGGCVVSANEPLLNWLAFEAEELHGREFWSLLWERHPHWREPVTELLARQQTFDRLELADAEGAPAQWFTLEIARHHSNLFVRLSSSLPPVANWGELGWEAPLRSDEAQRQMFLRLTRAEAQLAHLVRRWPGVIFSQRPDLSFQFISERIEEWTGISLDEWQRDPRHFHEVIHECDAAELQQQFKRASQTPGGSVATFRIRHVTTGRVTYVREHREALTTRSGLLLGYEGIWADVSRQTIAEKRLSNASWMETLAVLTAGLAHDFSNVIAGVQSLSEAFQAQLPPEHSFQEGLVLINQNTQHATQIVRRILNLHQGKAGERGYHDLNELVKELVELIRKTVPRRIRIHVEVAPGQLPVYADAVELRQVFVNLVLNAVDAMPDQGSLTIRTLRHETLPPQPHMLGTRPPGSCVGVEVKDEGTGIPARHLDAIFNPFYTTKPANKGSGLGLYNARLFVDKHRGALSVDSKENVGTTFSLWLAEADFSEAEQARFRPPLTRRTLLLVGPAGRAMDDAAVGLRQQGHYVVTANTGDAARELLSAPDYEFSAAMVIAAQRETVAHPLFRYIRNQKLPMRTILQIVGCNQDEFDTRLLDDTDLVLGAGTAAAEMPARVTALLDDFPNPTP